VSIAIVTVVDTGVDDALALVVAVRHPALDLRGVVCTGGNVPLPRVLTNTRYVLGLLDAEVPIAVGAERRLDGRPFGDRSVHGPDGLAGLGPPDDPPDGTSAPTAADLITPDAVVVSLAPLTPLVGVPAGRIVASYARPGQGNYEMDPAAAAAVVVEHSDVSDHPVRITPGGTPVGELVTGLLRHQARRAKSTGDAAVLLNLAEPELDPRQWARSVQSLAVGGD
jgi:hypothetical protein